ncbi:MAG: NAD(P)/FAD-dependent oxidoreductase [Bacteroidales bacterium]|nr:NAD(P)/FAD-dependent oxidoreductase [Bacteroidales bacterium]
MQKLLQLRLDVEEYMNVSMFENILAKKSNIDKNSLSYCVIKESLDCRKSPLYNVSVIVSNDNDLPNHKIAPLLDIKSNKSVIIVGAGPAGLFAAIKLLQHGIKPIIIERGSCIEKRKVDVANINRNNEINTESNICFGEGGAGTFSDGKLYTRSNKKGNIEEVLEIFVHFGAEEKILRQTHSHIGTDKLSFIIKNIRKEILLHGGEYLFDSKVVDFIVKDNTVKGVKIADKGEVYADKVILATGHSARDIYQLFYDRGWKIESQNFAMGVRVEHPQQLINQIQYHSKHPSSLLPAATYSLTCNANDRGIFSFCMCPGGIIVPSMDRPNTMVVNGMSNSLRNGEKANAAIVVSVKEEDAKQFHSYGTLSLMMFQQEIEKNMYIHKQIAPGQRITDFMENRLSSSLVKSSYIPGVESVDMNDMLPKFVCENLKIGFKNFDKKMRGFITKDSMLIGLESRTSSPVRITRDADTLQHLTLKNLYPCGEGAGYSGGITSSAMDGINIANKIIEQWGM